MGKDSEFLGPDFSQKRTEYPPKRIASSLLGGIREIKGPFLKLLNNLKYNLMKYRIVFFFFPGGVGGGWFFKKK